MIRKIAMSRRVEERRGNLMKGGWRRKKCKDESQERKLERENL
jgi:hypothetical protein